MKGMVFTMLSDMVEEKFGVQIWDDLIAATNPATGGVTEVSPSRDACRPVAAGPLVQVPRLV